jgi:hypothetical protein
MAIVKLHEGRASWVPALPGEDGVPHPRGKPGLWTKHEPPQYEVFAPPGQVLSATRTHSAMAWRIEEAREMERSTEPCEAGAECDICHPEEEAAP